MEESDALTRARQIAEAAHAGQEDKLGRPFMSHLERVAVMVDGPRAKTIAYLHDLIEKAPGWTEGRLVEEGFENDIIEAVDALTRRSGEDYLGFARRALENENARPVKLADLIDNRQQVMASGKDPSKYEAALSLAYHAVLHQSVPRT